MKPFFVVSVVAHLVGVTVLAVQSPRAATRAPISIEIVAPTPPPEPLPPAPPPTPPPPKARVHAAIMPMAAVTPPAPPEPIAPAPTVTPDTPVAGAGDVALPTSPAPPAPPKVIGRAQVIAAAPGPTGAGVDLGAYTNALGRAIARHRRYPEMAAQMGQEGTALVLVHVRRDGSLDGSPQIAESSGFDLLDKEAIAMVGRAAPFAALPAGLPQTVAELRVPVRFHLED